MEVTYWNASCLESIEDRVYVEVSNRYNNHHFPSSILNINF